MIGMNQYGALVEFNTDGKNETLRERCVPVPLRLTKTHVNRPNSFLMKAKYVMQSNI
jgi:hypothetical protein